MNALYDFFHKNHVLAICEDAIQKRSFTLNLSRLELVDVPNLIQQCGILLKLFLNNNKIQKLPATLSCLSRLQVLTLDYNNLDEFPKVICLMTQLRVLNVSNNHITKLPDEIGHLSMLETFWCNNTGLKVINTFIGNCERLETFGARGNCLKKLPESIGLLKNLRWLTFETNQLEDVPSTMVSLNKLVHLNLKSNKLWCFPKCLLQMKQLQFVFLNCNCITQMPISEELYETRFMRMLNLSDNNFCSNADARLILERFGHIYYDANLTLRDQHASIPQESSDEEDDGMVENTTSDWENSVKTSDLDSTADSSPDFDMEDVTMLIPELSRYITNFG